MSADLIPVDPMEDLRERVERLEGKVDNIEIGMGTLRASVAAFREDISVHLRQALSRTERKIIQTMQDEVVSKLQSLLEFKEGSEKDK